MFLTLCTTSTKFMVGFYCMYLRFTDEGQRQNPEVPGNGPVINIDSAIARFVYSVFLTLSDVIRILT